LVNISSIIDYISTKGELTMKETIIPINITKETTCLLTGHRHLPKDKIAHIVRRLDVEIDRLMEQGVTTFIAGGALGFDHIASLVVINSRMVYPQIRLVLALPFRDYDKKWPSDKHRLLYRELSLPKADEVIYVSDEYDKDCYRRRNQFMVDNAAYCICALVRGRTGTAQTVRMAKEQGLEVINVAD
jgi:uncharacterized phage-like protein YoqJ